MNDKFKRNERQQGLKFKCEEYKRGDCCERK